MSTKTVYAINWHTAMLKAADADNALVVLAKAYMTGVLVERPQPDEVAHARGVMGEMLDVDLRQVLAEYHVPPTERLVALVLTLQSPSEALSASDLTELERVTRHYNAAASWWFHAMMGV